MRPRHCRLLKGALSFPSMLLASTPSVLFFAFMFCADNGLDSGGCSSWRATTLLYQYISLVRFRMPSGLYPSRIKSVLDAVCFALGPFLSGFNRTPGFSLLGAANVVLVLRLFSIYSVPWFSVSPFVRPQLRFAPPPPTQEGAERALWVAACSSVLRCAIRALLGLFPRFFLLHSSLNGVYVRTT